MYSICFIPTFSCDWSGDPCNHTSFQQRITDFGLCYTFNGDVENVRQTAKTGKQHKCQQEGFTLQSVVLGSSVLASKLATEAWFEGFKNH